MKKWIALLMIFLFLLSGCSQEQEIGPEAAVTPPPIGEQYAISFARLRIVDTTNGIEAIVEEVRADTHFLEVGKQVELDIPTEMLHDCEEDLYSADWRLWIKDRILVADSCIYDVTYNILHTDNAVWKGEDL